MDEIRDTNSLDVVENTLYYSPATAGFYATDTHRPESVPEDAVAITTERYAALLAAEAAGQRIVFDPEQGLPVAEAVVASLDEIKRIRIRALHQGFNTALNAGFTSDALGSTHHYDSEAHNRENLIGAVATSAEQMFTCDDNQGNPDSKQQRRHTAEQLKQVLIDGAAVKQALIARFRERRAQVWAATDETEVNAIAWDDE